MSDVFNNSLLTPRLGVIRPFDNEGDYLSAFGSLTTNVERVDFVYKDIVKHKLCPKVIPEKNDNRSILGRRDGNDEFSKRRYLAALKKYTLCLVLAATPKYMSLAYANRSACLLLLGKFDECLTDIDRALANDYPPHLQAKLKQRRDSAERKLQIVKRNERNNKHLIERYHEDIPEIQLSQRNPKIQCATKSIEIQTNGRYGRHVVATEDIAIGEILCVEQPFSHSVVFEEVLHCHTCLEQCYNLIPCGNCCFGLFCSENCKNNAKDSFHKFECCVSATLYMYGIGSLQLLALRAAIQAKDDCEQLDELKIDLQEMYRSDRYKEIHNLMSATDKHTIDYVYDQAVNAAVMFYILKHYTSFFDGPNRDLIERNFKEVLMLQLQIVTLNRLYILEKDSIVFNPSLKGFGFGLYSFVSLFNHSCYPNVIVANYGSTAVLTAVNTIKKGQQCFISYGLMCDEEPLEARQTFLEDEYFFKCKCIACEKCWPIWSNMLEFPLVPIHVTLEMTEIEYEILKTVVVNNDVNIIKNFVPRLIEQFKKCEMLIPWGNAAVIKALLVHCFLIMGNKKTLCGYKKIR